MQENARLEDIASRIGKLIGLKIDPKEVPELCLLLVEARLGISSYAPQEYDKIKMRARMLFWTSFKKLHVRYGGEW